MHGRVCELLFASSLQELAVTAKHTDPMRVTVFCFREDFKPLCRVNSVSCGVNLSDRDIVLALWPFNSWVRVASGLVK